MMVKLLMRYGQTLSGILNNDSHVAVILIKLYEKNNGNRTYNKPTGVL